MSIYAFLIGIDQYASEGDLPTLSTPVDDALRMTAWLATRGGVPPEQIVLRLSPTEAVEGGTLLQQVLARLPRLDEDLKKIGTDQDAFAKTVGRIAALGGLKAATLTAIRGALVAFPNQAPGGQRLYFYYAGHGMASRVSFSNEDAIIPADYEQGVVDAVGVSSIVRFFKPLAFPEQFFFLDCCRNLVLREEALGSAPVPQMLDPARPTSDQFIFNATAPGLKARDGRGMLTDLLIDGLLGKGRAKEWDRRSRQYVVRPKRLFDYICEQFDARPRPVVVGEVGGTELIQKPRLGGERNTDPDMIAYPEAQVPPVRFSLTIAPGEVVPIAQVRVTGDRTDISQSNIPGSPILLSLKPRIYTVSVAVPDPADAWEASDGPWTLDVYDPDPYDWPVVFQQKGGGGGVAAVASQSDRGGGGGGRSADDSPSFDLPASPRSMPDEGRPTPSGLEGAFVVTASDPGSPHGRIVVEADDPLAHLELVSESSEDSEGDDKARRRGTGSIDCAPLDPGFYRARMSLPEGPSVERPIELKAGQSVTLRLSAPPAPMTWLARELLSRAGRSAGAGVGAGPSLSALLALACGASIRGRVPVDGGAGLLRAALWPEDRGAAGPPGLQVLLAVEPAAASGGERDRSALDTPEKVRAYLRGIEARAWPLDGEPGPGVAPELTAVPGIASYATAATPGAHWLNVRAPSGDQVALPLCILEGRTTEVTFHETGEGSIRIYQFLLSTRPDKPTAAAAIRRADLVQRFLRKGLIAEALAVTEGILDFARPDPIAGCLAGYLMIRGRQFDDLARLGSAMAESHPRLPDSHVLLAFQREMEGRHDQAVDSYRRALDAGLPITAQLLRVLAAGAARLGLEHPRRELLDRVEARLIPAVVWTSWIPDAGWPGPTAE